MKMTKMKRKLDNEKGLTLIEVLATLVIGSMFLLLAMTMLGTTVRMNQVSMNETRIQQEANAIITELQENHRESDCYTLDADEGQVRIGGCDEGRKKRLLGSGVYVHNLTASESIIRPKEIDVDLELVLQDPDNNHSYDINATLSHVGVLR